MTRYVYNSLIKINYISIKIYLSILIFIEFLSPFNMTHTNNTIPFINKLILLKLRFVQLRNTILIIIEIIYV